MEKLYNLFTYGTLMQGFDNPYARKLRLSANYIGKGYFNGKLFRVEWYPGALYEPDAPTRVHGEIYQLHSPEILKELDEYEDVLEDKTASLYVRKVVPVRCGQEVVRCGQEIVKGSQEVARSGQEIVKGSQEVVRCGREIVKGGQEVVRDCWVYLYNQPVSDLPLIEDGYFKTRP